MLRLSGTRSSIDQRDRVLDIKIIEIICTKINSLGQVVALELEEGLHRVLDLERVGLLIPRVWLGQVAKLELDRVENLEPWIKLLH